MDYRRKNANWTFNVPNNAEGREFLKLIKKYRNKKTTLKVFPRPTSGKMADNGPRLNIPTDAVEAVIYVEMK